MACRRSKDAVTASLTPFPEKYNAWPESVDPQGGVATLPPVIEDHMLVLMALINESS